MADPMHFLTTAVREYRRIFAHHDPEDLVHYPEDGDYLIDDSPPAALMHQAKAGNRPLMSGYRGHPKQMLLYLDMLRLTGTCLLLKEPCASGLFYHFSGDFDIGDRRLGDANFSSIP